MEKKPSDQELIAEAIFMVAKAIRILGEGNIDRSDETPGALTTFGFTVTDSSKRIADSLDNIADAIRTLAQEISLSK